MNSVILQERTKKSQLSADEIALRNYYSLYGDEYNKDMVSGVNPQPFSEWVKRKFMTCSICGARAIKSEMLENGHAYPVWVCTEDSHHWGSFGL